MSDIKPRIKHGKSRASLNWTHLNAVITGISSIDIGSLAIRNRKEAMNFAREYGFDMEDPMAVEDVGRAHAEAVAFIDQIFLSPEQRNLVSPEIRNPEHLLDLLVYSSNYLNKSNIRQMWACAVLKVMHGIFHMDHDAKLMYFDEIRSQIFEPIDKLLLSEGDHHYLSDGDMRIPLFFYEKKRNKGRKSILLKLLQKPNYVAADIYDHLGVRFVFETKIECLFALKLLRRCHLITVTNIKPFRSRNSLLDLSSSKKVFNQFRPLLARSKDYPLDVMRKIDRELEDLGLEGKDYNPHSSKEFKSIQMTARRMIRITNPVYRRMQELLAWANSRVDVPEHFLAEAELDRELSFYFDYEIQLMDKESYTNSLHGPASHAAYKKRQKETARRRVLGATLIKHLAEEA